MAAFDRGRFIFQKIWKVKSHPFDEKSIQTIGGIHNVSHFISPRTWKENIFPRDNNAVVKTRISLTSEIRTGNLVGS